MVNCKVIQDVLDLGEGSDNEVNLNYLNIEPKIFENIVKYLKFASENQEPKISKPLLHFNSIYEITLPWYATFANGLSDDELCGTLYVAHRLQIDPLIDLLAAKLAIILNPLSIEDKRKFFNVKGDFTEAEMNEVEEQNKEAMELYKDDIDDY